MLDLAAGDYRLELDPSRGGAVMLFEWRGKSVLRPVCGPSILDVASFPLVPFSNRIAWGRFEVDGQQIVLAPNFRDQTIRIRSTALAGWRNGTLWTRTSEG